MSKTKTQQVVELWQETQDVSIEEHIINNWEDSHIGIGVIQNDLENSVDVDEYQHLAYMADQRSIIELMEETVRGWIIEDIVCAKIDMVSLNGSDAERKIAEEQTNITTDPDLTTPFNKIEVATDFGEYWKEECTHEIRASKWMNMSPNTFVLGVDVVNKEFMLWQKKDMETKYIDTYFPYGGKSVHSVYIDGEEFKEF